MLLREALFRNLLHYYADMDLYFSEAPPLLHEETGPSEANLFTGKYIIDPNQAPSKQVKPVARLHKTLKFRLLSDDDKDASVEANTQKS